ncbi:hypothetical protein D5F01_LYC17003 [Larimichthys crocea]|uniref:Uncharacterized protein n=1 Tax=Larimichthys crocea TaxID=215358 RepID=A0A6G0I260_LARCR|nr:hypothetical protein D5F01_LYC17003 [Larimichthys crocea]
MEEVRMEEVRMEEVRMRMEEVRMEERMEEVRMEEEEERLLIMEDPKALLITGLQAGSSLIRTPFIPPTHVLVSNLLYYMVNGEPSMGSLYRAANANTLVTAANSQQVELPAGRQVGTNLFTGISHCVAAVSSVCVLLDHREEEEEGMLTGTYVYDGRGEDSEEDAE